MINHHDPLHSSFLGAKPTAQPSLRWGRCSKSQSMRMAAVDSTSVDQSARQLAKDAFMAAARAGDSCICESWLIHVRHDSFTCETCLKSRLWLLHVQVIHVYVRVGGPCICESWLIHVRHDSFTYETCLKTRLWQQHALVRNMTHVNVSVCIRESWLIHVRHDSFTCETCLKMRLWR